MGLCEPEAESKTLTHKCQPFVVAAVKEKGCGYLCVEPHRMQSTGFYYKSRGGKQGEVRTSPAFHLMWKKNTDVGPVNVRR